MKPSFKKNLSEVLGYQTVEKELLSNSGTTYVAEVIEIVRLVSTGLFEKTKDGKYRYGVVDVKNKLEYEVKVPNFIEVAFGNVLEFKNLTGGSFENGGSWFKADSVSVVPK